MSDEFNFSNESNDENEFSFGSILAEVKGSAFIEGDKRTPSDILQEKADRILREAAGSTSSFPQQEGMPAQSPTFQPHQGSHSMGTEAMPGMINPHEQQELPRTISSATERTRKNDFNFDFDDVVEPEFSDVDDIPMIVTPLENEIKMPQFDSTPSFFNDAMNAATSKPPEPAKPGATSDDEWDDFVIPTYDAGFAEREGVYRNPQSEIIGNPVVQFDQYRNENPAGQQPVHEQPVFEQQPNSEQQPEFEQQPTYDQQPTSEYQPNHEQHPNYDQQHVPMQGQETRVFRDEFSYDEQPEKKSKWSLSNLFARGPKHDNTGSSMDMFEEHSEQVASVDELPEEPPLKHATRKFARSCNSMSIRVMPATVITIFMLVVTFAFEAGRLLPFGIGHNLDFAAGTLIICLLFVMMLCSDILVRGFDFLKKGEPNAETLILFSCALSIISAAFTMITDLALLLPFNAVSALSLTFAAYGEKYNLRAITDSLKTAVGSSEPYGVQAEYNKDIDRTVLKKSYNKTEGFYNNLMQPDITEIIYRYAAPALLVGSILLTILVVIFRSGAEYSLHVLSALVAASAPFSAILAFAIPFATVVRATRGSGVALAGWSGVDDIYYTDGVCVTDDDLFPPGMLKLSGVKVYDGASSDEAIMYTASLVMASGSGLTGLFEEVLKQQGLTPLEVESFECHESGIGGLIKGNKVVAGSAAFMNLLGVRVPDDTNMKNAVYTAVGGRLVAMFAVDYKPLPSVQSALISMLKWRIDLYFAMRDFNVTPAMVGQKFKVPFDSFVFIPAKDSYRISDLHSEEKTQISAILLREGLNPFAESITSSRLLRSAAFFASILSVASAGLGVLIMFYISWTGAFLSASPGNLVIFMLCMLATVLIVCGYVRLKK